jgi:hypothetical protein
VQRIGERSQPVVEDMGECVATMPGAVLLREQLVAACLVGTVIVLVAFASGLGINTTERAGSVPDQGPARAAGPPASVAPPVTAGSTVPSQPGGGGFGGAPYVPPPQHYAGAGPTTASVSRPSSPTAATPTPTTPGTTASSPTAAPAPSPTAGCTPDLLQALIKQVAAIAANLPVLAPLLAELRLDSPDGLLAQVPVIGGVLVAPTPSPSPTPTPTLSGVSGPCAGLLTSLLSQVSGS